jgi:hypothetical protein
MDKDLAELREMTRQLADRLAQADFEEMCRFVERREQMVRRIREGYDGNPTPEQIREVANLLKFDGPILGKMEQLRSQAASSLAKLEQSRIRRNAYEKIYAMESAFIDRKK